MIELTTVDGAKVWIAAAHVVAVTQAKSQDRGGPPVPVLGVSMLIVAGGGPPLIVKGTPEEISNRVTNDGKHIFAA
jgi:uncharacterized protein YlzI (FlbEa/FlbD family)